ncbi:hypothetical protein Ahy_A10g047443 [Arachis hypogaea]|uniref:Uncharacterized protein n=1 Tax=Arachis hypogaea TaxID=3818 RepID=A0A445B2M9_ARAHY|nr:hypothetical protein Ahy_A10g047443 [Arachis hypogaea]
MASAYDYMVCSTSYSRTKQEYNKNYQRLKEMGEEYTQWCDEISVQRWVLAFDRDHHWGHMTTNLSTFYQLNELFTRKSTEAHERVHNGFTYSEFATKRVEESFRRAGNIVVNDSTGAMRCLRFAKCKMVPFTLLTLHNNTVIVDISRSSDFHVATSLHVALTNVLIGKYMCMTCTRCLKFARFTKASLSRWVAHPHGLRMKERR